MLSLIAGFFQDVNEWVNLNIGDVGVTILICMLSVIALLLFWNVFRASIGKTKFVFKWGQTLLLIIVILAIVWLCTMY